MSDPKPFVVGELLVVRIDKEPYYKPAAYWAAKSHYGHLWYVLRLPDGTFEEHISLDVWRDSPEFRNQLACALDAAAKGRLFDQEARAKGFQTTWYSPGKMPAVLQNLASFKTWQQAEVQRNLASDKLYPLHPDPEIHEIRLINTTLEGDING
jgi:hypothetical protein